MNKLGRRVLDTLECLTAVSLLHSCPWSLEPVRAVVNIHMLSIHRSRLQAASLDIFNPQPLSSLNKGCFCIRIPCPQMHMCEKHLEVANSPNMQSGLQQQVANQQDNMLACNPLHFGSIWEVCHKYYLGSGA